MKPLGNPFAESQPGTAPAAKPSAASPAKREGLRQIDGNISDPGVKATKGPLQDRRASPSNYNTSGMEGGMGALADKLHPVKPRRR